MKEMKRSVVFRNSSKWVMTAIDEIVRNKEAAGFKTSFSYEIVRLAGNALTSDNKGAKIDEIILGKKDVSDKK